MSSSETQEVAFKKLIADTKKDSIGTLEKLCFTMRTPMIFCKIPLSRSLKTLVNSRGTVIYTLDVQDSYPRIVEFVGKSRQLGISNEEWIEKQATKLESDVYFEGDEMQLKLQKLIATLPKNNVWFLI